MRVSRCSRTTYYLELDRDDVREVYVARYRIVYRVERGGIAVVTMFEGHRRMPGAHGFATFITLPPDQDVQ